jgi:hypothetical protein
MRIALVAGVAALAVALTGCSSEHKSKGAGATGGASGGSTAGSSAGAEAGGTASPAPGGAAGASCLAGTWRSTGVSMSTTSGGATSSASGGAGVVLTVGRDGKVSVDFDQMKPVTFTTTVSGAEIKGQYTYAGKATGAVAMPASGAASGTWQPSGSADWSALTVTVDLTSPVEARIFDHAKISDFAGAGGGETGGSVDAQPLLGAASYACSGNTLTLKGPSGAAWTMQRG